MEYPNKIVDFHSYCKNCEYQDNIEVDDPCDECLTASANEYSKKPIHFKEKTDSQKKHSH